MNDEKFDKLLRGKMQEDKEMPERINQLFSNFEMEVMKMEKNEKIVKQMNKQNKRMKRFSLVTSIIGIFGACGIAYATVVPQEWKTNITNFINRYFGVDYVEGDYNGGVQDKTVESIISSNIQNPEKYSRLLDADIYGLGDSDGGVLIESNYKQYNFNSEHEEEVNLEKYTKKISIKMGMIKYSLFDNMGYSYYTSPIEETLKIQDDEFKNNLNTYYHREEEFTDKLFFELTGMTIMNGNNRSEEDFLDYSRAKKIKLTFTDGSEEIINLLDTDKAQFVNLSYKQNDISKPIEITIEVLETYPGNISSDVYLADVQFGIDSNIPMGR